MRTKSNIGGASDSQVPELKLLKGVFLSGELGETRETAEGEIAYEIVTEIQR